MSKPQNERGRFGYIIGKNSKLLVLYGLIEGMKNMSPTVLISGETGTGKGLLSRTIHENSLRKDFPFITVDCGSIPETLLESELFGHEKGAFTGALKLRRGKFEQAHGGTVFLDEIGDISPAMQQRLLRVLQDHEMERLGGDKTINVDVRIIAASNKNLSELVEKGIFREDLFYRLNIIPLHLPPLRERLDDLPALADHFLSRYCRKLNKNVKKISQEALNTMMKYHWPGNIRELENLLERAIIMAPDSEINSIDIPGERRNKRIYSFGEINTSFPLRVVREQVVAELEKKYLGDLLKKCRGNIGKVAGIAEIDNKTLYEKMKRHNLRKEDYKQ
ncbi:MAG: sigma-54 interaction domain-containing protein [bacterium]